MESEQKIDHHPKNIFSTYQGKILAATVGIASLLAACGFDNDQAIPPTPILPPSTATIETHHQQSYEELIQEWQQGVRSRLQDHALLLSDEELVESVELTTGKDQSEYLDYLKKGGIIVTGYAGQLPDLSTPPGLYKIFAGSKINSAIIRQGINMKSQLTGNIVDRKFIYFNCSDVQGDVLDLNDQPIPETERDFICAIPLDYALLPQQ